MVGTLAWEYTGLDAKPPPRATANEMLWWASYTRGLKTIIQQKLIHMNPIRINTITLFGNTSFGAIALIAGVWLNTASSSLGITIGLASGSDPNCTGSVSVQGNISCTMTCEGPAPVVTLNNTSCMICSGNGSQPSVNATCSGGLWTGTWGAASISLAKGVNVLMATDNCGSATLKITSNGGGGPAWSYAQGTAFRCGIPITITISCLIPFHSYRIHETFNNSDSCYDPGTPADVTKTSDGNGTIVLNDVCTATCPPYASSSECKSTNKVTNHLADAATPNTDIDSDDNTRVIDGNGTTQTLTITFQTTVTFQ